MNSGPTPNQTAAVPDDHDALTAARAEAEGATPTPHRPPSAALPGPASSAPICCPMTLRHSQPDTPTRPLTDPAPD